MKSKVIRLFTGALSLTMLLSTTACNIAPNTPAKISGSVVTPVYPVTIAFGDYDSRQKLRDENPLHNDFLDHLKNFSYETASSILNTTEINSNYSPLSLYLALALAGSGANGTTQQELLHLLGTKNTQELSLQCGNLYRLLCSNNEVSQLKIANSLWLKQDELFKKSYTENAKNNFYASLFNVDFTNKKTATSMRQWIADNTNNTLSPSMDFPPNQLMTILSTVYFYDEWIDRFDKSKTAKATFKPTNEDEIKCDFMNMTYMSHSYSDGNGFIRSSLGLKNGGNMVFILPDEGVSTGELMTSPESVKNIFENGEDSSGEVVFKIPKFSFDSNFNFKETLKNLGLQSAFEDNADFSGITDGIAFISGVTQQTHIAIDENGVEASAFTKIDYCGSAMPKGRAEMILDRPFIYGITASNGTPLFIGVCENPLE